MRPEAYYGENGVIKKRDMHGRDKYQYLVQQYNNVIANLHLDTHYNTLFDNFAKHEHSCRGKKQWPSCVENFKSEKMFGQEAFTEKFKKEMAGEDGTMEDNVEFLSICKFGEFIEKTAKDTASEINNSMNVNWIDSKDLRSGYTEGCK